MFRKILVMTCLLLSQLSLGQSMQLRGTVTDSTGSKPLSGALVMGIRFKDSLLLGHTRTNSLGVFSISNFPLDTFSLLIAYPGYDDKVYYIFGTPDNNTVDIPNVKMSVKTKELEEVVIYANKNPIYFKGDTLVYVADSFKVGEHAVVEDLLKKLPGIKVDNEGKITAQGKEISQVLVDGDEFFGSDPTIATRNLGAKGIESVQVYEKKNENAKAGEDQTLQVMDLKLKEDAKKGYFGKLSGASDFGLLDRTNPFYESEVLLNKFNKSQKISVFGLASNTPKSNFNWGDMNKFGLDNERNSSGMSMWNRKGSNNTGGIPQTIKAGFYFSDKLGAKGKITVNYSFYENKLRAYSSQRSQYFLPDSTYYTKDSTDNYSVNRSHNFSVTYTTKIDSLTTLEVKPNFVISTALQDNKSFNSFIGEDQVTTFSTFIQNKNESLGFTSNSEATLTKKFKKAKREAKYKYMFIATNNETEGNLFNRNDYLKYNYSDTVDQRKLNNNSSMNHFNFITYTEPLGLKYKLELEYLIETGRSDQMKQTLNPLNGNYTIPVAALSNNFDNTRLQNRLTIKGIYESRVHTASIGLGMRAISIDNVNVITGNNIQQELTNFLPQAFYQYKPSQTKRFSVTYFTRSDAPSINDLQPVLDNTNPNRIQLGNPDLKPNYVHGLNSNFNTWNALTGRYIWSNLSSSLTNNAFANSTSYDSLGRMLSVTQNVNGNLFANLVAGGGYPIFNRKLTLEPSFNVNYSKYTNLINNLENVTRTTAVGGGMSLSLELDSLELSVGQEYSYSNPVSSLNSGSNTPFNTQKFTADLDWKLKRHFTIKADASYTMNQNLSAAYNLNIFLINAELSKAFLPTENLIVSLRANDILNQNKNIQRQVNGNVITDNYTRIISRYFLLRVTLKFNKNKTKEEDFHGWH